ncbi:Signal transduction histidine-protein kinase BarA [Zhongshania aliphaticivorans]|uniref:histidine kinase n=1 Tax=Zhongshania aliphaticivorans TaxID=1470434 RepID=A0A5S9QB47_9GAMM|nr:Signal transduction histidine-protein kinase BarA [Zhongshania aliphaticivorans]CAA0114642.1 Signal transduction histidine-protein kinase BarA [Zhongshania aliphaticivorans]
MRARLGIRKLILVMGLLPILTLSLALSTYLIFSQVNELRKLMTERAKTSSEQLAILAEHLLADDHQDTLAHITTTALEESAVKAIAIYSADLQLISQAGPKSKVSVVTIPSNDHKPQYQFLDDGLLIIQPVMASPHNIQTNTHVIGWVVIQYDWRHLKTQQYQTLFMGTIFFVFAFFMCVSLTSYINQSLATDLSTLRLTIRRMATGSRNFHAHIPENNEFNELAEELNQLNNAHKKELQELQRSIEQTNIDLRETLETVEVQNIELDLARREAVNASRIKSEFLANTSHEIRTPLSGIIGFSKILLKSELEIRQRDAVETIHNSANNLLTIINDILDFSKLEAGKLVLDNSPVNLRETVEDTLQLLAPSASENNLEFGLVIEHDTPDAVITDGLRLKQILTNLISNAIKFTAAGHIKVSILSKIINEQEVKITFQISDTGIGLSREQQQVIFKDFSQADASITRQYGGTGLGLVIVKGIIEQMGGDIGIDSSPGQGATFWFTLTLTISNSAISLRDFSALKGKSLALYDRSELSTQTLSSLFSNWGLDVHHTTNISELPTADYYVICSDGATELSNLLTDIHHPAIIITPYTEQHSSDNEHIYLSKPVAHVKLFDALHKGLQHHSLTSPETAKFPNTAILVVDDNPSNLHILGNFLTDMSISTFFAQNGAEALQQCREKHFDLIFMDIQMPHMDGIETSKQIRSDGLNINTPIIALSAYLSPDNPSQLRNAGINDYFSKPISEPQLATLLSHHLNLEQRDEYDERPVDIAECLRLTKHRPKLASEMLSMLLNTLPKNRKDIILAFQTANLTEVATLNHTLKGACCYTGTPALKRRVLELEQSLNKKLDSETEIDALINAIDALLAWRDEHDLDIVFET